MPCSVVWCVPIIIVCMSFFVFAIVAWLSNGLVWSFWVVVVKEARALAFGNSRGARSIGVYESTRVCFLSLFLCLGAMAGIKIFAHVGRKEKNPPPLVHTIKFSIENHVENPAFWGLENTKNRKSRLFVPPIIDTPPDCS